MVRIVIFKKSNKSYINLLFAGKKYYYNGKSGESVWEKPKELLDHERRASSGGNQAPPQAVPAVTTAAPVRLIEEPPEKIMSRDGPTSKVAAAQAIAKATNDKPKSMDKSRPVSSTPVHGTPWCVVWTGDSRAFFYNPSTKTSVWERPPDLIGRADVTEMLKSPAAAEKIKSKNVPPGFASNPQGKNKKGPSASADSGNFL
jgi:transcription elongation regulator 1